MAPKTKLEKYKKIKVILKCDHTHGGQECKKDDPIEVSERQQTWLKKKGII